jgi:hypothetical protein
MGGRPEPVRPLAGAGAVGAVGAVCSFAHLSRPCCLVEPSPCRCRRTPDANQDAKPLADFCGARCCHRPRVVAVRWSYPGRDPVLRRARRAECPHVGALAVLWCRCECGALGDLEAGFAKLGQPHGAPRFSSSKPPDARCCHVGQRRSGGGRFRHDGPGKRQREGRRRVGDRTLAACHVCCTRVAAGRRQPGYRSRGWHTTSEQVADGVHASQS